MISLRKDGKLITRTVDYSDVRQSVRDLARIYKPTDIKMFIRDYVRKYNIQKGIEDELEAIVVEELSKK